MHSIFIDKHPEFAGKIKYEYYLKYFHENFNYNICAYNADQQKTSRWGPISNNWNLQSGFFYTKFRGISKMTHKIQHWVSKNI